MTATLTETPPDVTAPAADPPPGPTMDTFRGPRYDAGGGDNGAFARHHAALLLSLGGTLPVLPAGVAGAARYLEALALDIELATRADWIARCAVRGEG